MGLFKQLKEFLGLDHPPAGSTPPWSGANPSVQQQPTQTANPQGAGHVERKRISFVQVGPNDTIAQRDEEWLRKGNIMEGVTHEVWVITGSGDITDPSNLKTICSQCLKAESVEIRSSISNLPLCRTCQRALGSAGMKGDSPMARFFEAKRSPELLASLRIRANGTPVKMYDEEQGEA